MKISVILNITKTDSQMLSSCQY